MNCEDLTRGEELERYVAGQLDEAAQTAVEAHVFECDACAARLDDLMAIRSALASPPPGEPLGLPTGRTPVAWYAQPLAVAAGIATLMFAAAGAIWWTRPVAPDSAPASAQSNRPAPVAAQEGPAGVSAPQADSAPPTARVIQKQAEPDWAALARFEAPAFVALAVRGGQGAASGVDPLAPARDAYAAGRHGEAVRLLDAWVSAHGSSPEVVFYRGVSRLQSSDIEGGLADLASVAGSSQAPYAVEANLYLAYGRLARQDLAGTRAALERYIALDGDFSAEARRLLERLPRPLQATP